MPKIVIDTDGTVENTKLKIDGEEIENPTDLSFFADLDCYCKCDPCYCTDVHFSYVTKRKDEEKEMLVRTRYTLDPAKASLVESEAGVNTKNPSSEDFENL